jgi:hypothetical protein
MQLAARSGDQDLLNKVDEFKSEFDNAFASIDTMPVAKPKPAKKKEQDGNVKIVIEPQMTPEEVA